MLQIKELGGTRQDRRHPRLDLSAGQRAALQVVLPAGEVPREVSDADVVNVSQSGMRVGSRQKLRRRTDVQLQLLRSRQAEQPLVVSGQVVWVDATVPAVYWHGVAFAPNSGPQMARLVQLLPSA
ncbi:MAG: hypothetical protein CL878_00340 [Dehalococcoidia bacterium]|nr:hypothetical protein [Dehalococcoidia bacterium]